MYNNFGLLFLFLSSLFLPIMFQQISQELVTYLDESRCYI